MADRPNKPTKDLAELVRGIVLGEPTAGLSIQLRTIGIHASDELAASVARIAKRIGHPERSNDDVAVLLLDLLSSPHPAEALVNLLRYLDTSPDPGTLLDTFAGGKPLREMLATVFGTSRYISDIIVRNPGYLYWLIEKRTWELADTRESLLEDARRDMTNFQTVTTRLNAVRRLQRRMLLKIGVQDLMGIRTIEETTQALSVLADAVIECVLEILWIEKFGELPERESGFAVLALGKLGGAELNYSSDIDLIYLCADNDDKAFEKYTELAKRLTVALSDVSDEGYLYRVDLRLRPDGDIGPIVSSLSTTMVYYENRGRPWEFQAMLKARVVAGDDALGEDFLKRVGALTFSDSLSYSPVETVAAMRTRIRDNISSRDRAYNIKLMEGGIRDIEFIVQSLQLAHGSREPALRVTNTTDCIEALHERKRLDDLEHATLLDAYRFFRLVEHRLQMMHQLKTHSIPQSVDEVSILARRVSKGPLGTFGHEDFLGTLTTHLNKVRVLSDSHFSDEELPESATLLLLPRDDRRAANILKKYKHGDPAQTIGVIQSLAYGSFPHLLDRVARAAFQALLPALLERLSSAPDPSRAFVQFERIVAGTRNRASLYARLAESEPMLALACDIAATSPSLTAKLSKQPDLLDALAEAPDRVTAEPMHNIRWQALSGKPDERQTAAERVRHEADRRLLAAWVCDVNGGSLPDTLARTVTRTTRDIVTAAFDSVLDDKKGVALLALGSFGIGEPRPGSDVDLLVVTRNRDIEPVTRAVQSLNRVFNDTGLLKLDFRLRGEGASAPLVQDIETYERYFAERLSPWERVAFVKCAPWCGDHKVGKAFLRLLAPRAANPFDGGAIRALRDTRRQLEGLVGAGTRAIETKRSAGGRYDIEYMCAIGLAHLGKPYALDATTKQRIEFLGSGGLLSDDEARTISEAAELYARVECLVELGADAPATAEGTAGLCRDITVVMSLLGLPLDGALDEVIAEHRRSVRSVYNRFMKEIARR